MFLSNLQSLKQAIIKFNHFGAISGLWLNIDKTELVPLGDLHLDLSQITGDLLGIKITNGPFRTLGIWFTRDDNTCTQLNFNERIKNIKQVLEIWKLRALSWKGKITILKSLIAPQLIHLLSTLYTPASILEEIDKLFFDFLWANKPPRVKKCTIVQK